MSGARFTWERAFRQAPKSGTFTPATVAVALALATFVDGGTGQGARPSRETLALASGVSRRRVLDALSRLAEAGWIERTGVGPRGVSVYRLTVPAGPGASQRRGTSSPPISP